MTKKRTEAAGSEKEPSKVFNVYSLVMTEKKCMTVYYPISKRHNEGSIYVCGPGPHRDNIYKSFKADLDNLEQVAGPDNFDDWDLIDYYLGPRSVT